MLIRFKKLLLMDLNINIFVIIIYEFFYQSSKKKVKISLKYFILFMYLLTFINSYGKV